MLTSSTTFLVFPPPFPFFSLSLSLLLSPLLFTSSPFLPHALLYFPTLLPHARSRLCPRAPSTPYRVLLVELYAPHPSDRSHIYRATPPHFSHHPPLFPFCLLDSPHASSMSDDAQACWIFLIPFIIKSLKVQEIAYSLWGMSSSCWQLEPIHNRNSIPKRSSLSSMRRNIISTVLNNYFSNSSPSLSFSLPFSLFSARSPRKPLFLRDNFV